jgi:NADH-quinone oxidoreductase subunit C
MQRRRALPSLSRQLRKSLLLLQKNLRLQKSPLPLLKRSLQQLRKQSRQRPVTSLLPQLPHPSPMVSKLKRQFGSGIEALTYLGQNYLNVDRSLIPNLLKILCDEEQFDYCVDVTAVHYPKRERQFDIVWILYSFERNERMRVKTQIAEGEHIPSAVSIWPTANWLEREAYDMFGIHFDGHPDLKRILLPDGWKGHPLRKDYGIIQQDQEWVQINLGIESGQ